MVGVPDGGGDGGRLGTGVGGRLGNAVGCGIGNAVGYEDGTDVGNAVPLVGENVAVGLGVGTKLGRPID